jgi:NADPH-dependent 2,4-dienoyl-CoA reductase/sulfur reductase-like enzyme
MSEAKMTGYAAARPPERGRAVVLGASMGGLLAARVLSESFAEVVVIERDDLSAPGDRRGVPQGRHVHALLARGRQILEELFPGLTAQLLADGAVECRSLTEMRMTVAGHTLRQSDSGYSLLQASRPFLEWRVRERVRALTGVRLIDNTAAEHLLTDATRDRVTGVRVTGRDIPADLVVSSTGRHGPVGDWLADLGYERPAEEGVRIDMKYASRYLRLPAGSAPADKEIVIANQNPAAAGERDAAIGRQISRIAGLLDPPTALLRPDLLARTALTLGGIGLRSLHRPGVSPAPLALGGLGLRGPSRRADSTG